VRDFSITLYILLPPSRRRLVSKLLLTPSKLRACVCVCVCVSASVYMNFCTTDTVSRILFSIEFNFSILYSKAHC
jgi:hypothetical protein